MNLNIHLSSTETIRGNLIGYIPEELINQICTVYDNYPVLLDQIKELQLKPSESKHRSGNTITKELLENKLKELQIQYDYLLDQRKHDADFEHKLRVENLSLKEKIKEITALDIHNMAIPQNSASFQSFMRKQNKLKKILGDK